MGTKWINGTFFKMQTITFLHANFPLSRVNNNTKLNEKGKQLFWEWVNFTWYFKMK